ncbi:MAG: fused MFS/spermidine synthase [Candidatus Obscuribacterales bacterium]|nr:fused MFS/spermidine synthase [Candidatus Obscuribacterales bacterium]
MESTGDLPPTGESGSKSNNDHKANRASRREFVIVAVLFLLSGLSSLIYQVIWTRMLVFVFGSTTFASSTVLAVFMGGLAIGSFVAGRKSDKIANPFLWYGILEGIIGIFALAAPHLFSGIGIPLYKMIYQSMHLSIIPFSILRFLVAALILLPPTAAMGATLPLLSKFVTTSLDVVGDRVGTLYAINTLGAVIGSITAGFFLLPTFGLSTTIVLAAAINISLMGVVYVFSKLWTQKPEARETATVATAPLSQEPPTVQPQPVATSSAIPVPVLVTMISFGFSGAIAMTYEVAWTRTLLMIIGSTTYAFSVMLSTFLIGIFLGSFVCARWADKLKDPVLWFGAFEMLLCLGGLMSLLLFNYLPYWNLSINARFLGNPDAAMAIRFLITGMVLLPITLCLGAIFPLAIKACTRDLEKVGRSVGTIYSINTLGAIIGAFAAGFFIVPYLGAEKTLILCSVLNLVLGMALIIPFAKGIRAPVKIFATIATAVLCLWSLQQPEIWDHLMLLSSQKERRALAFSRYNLPSYDEYRKNLHDLFEILFWEDGLCANVAVLKTKAASQRTMYTSGHADASDGYDMRNFALPPAYALLLRPAAKDVAVVGWGSGVMLGYGLRFPINKMVCAEIEPAVKNAAVLFDHVSMKPQDDKRLRLEAADGRNYLLATDEKFDAIVSQPSNPWQAGVCNLFTSDYFGVAKDRLNKGGIFAMWLQHAEVSSDNVLRVLSALRHEFKHVLVMESDSTDICALASDEPLDINLQALGAAFKNPEIAKALSGFDLTIPEDMAARVCIAPAQVDALVKDVPPNSDDVNHLEYDVAKTYEQKHFVYESADFFLKNGGNLWDAVNWGDISPHDKALKLAEIAERCLKFNVKRSIRWADESLKIEPNARALGAIGLAYCDMGEFSKALEAMNEAVKLAPTDGAILQSRAIVELKAGALSLARKDLQYLLSLESNNKAAKYRLAQTYSPVFTEDRFEQSITPMDDFSKQVVDPALVLSLTAGLTADAQFVDKHPGVLYLVADALHRTGKDRQAIPLMERYVGIYAKNVLAWRLLGTMLSREDKPSLAAYCWQHSMALGQGAAKAMRNKAASLLEHGKVDEAVTVLKHAIEMSPDDLPARQVLMEQAIAGNAAAESVIAELARLNRTDAAALERFRQDRARLKR